MCNDALDPLCEASLPGHCLIKDGAYLVWIAVMTRVIKDDDDGF